ncbi:hypothetical protein BX600DRAFT_507985 [Xylariales sp. PMI_506]|nr:hypothetical protein BX600DRAFT_507985 [Xylariales sp. PMI_506]
MDTVIVTCEKCDATVGEFVNVWTQIGKSYISPIIVADGSQIELMQTGPVRPGESQTLVDHCLLQDVSCSQCRTVLGLECIETLSNHVLSRNQSMLRLTLVTLTGVETRATLKPAIQRILILRAPRASSAMPDEHRNQADSSLAESGEETDTENARDASRLNDLSILQADLDAQRNDILRIDSAGYQIVSTFDHSILRIQSEMAKLKDEFNDLQRKLGVQTINQISQDKTITSLQSGLRGLQRDTANNSRLLRFEDDLLIAQRFISSVRDEMSAIITTSVQDMNKEHKAARSALGRARSEVLDLRREVEDIKRMAEEDILVAKTYAHESIKMKLEIDRLRKELAHERSRTQPAHQAKFFSDELDILTTSITKIGTKANEVDNLQMELQILKTKMQKIETRQAEVPDSNNIMTDFPGAGEEGDGQMTSSSIIRKRKRGRPPKSYNEASGNASIGPSTKQSLRSDDSSPLRPLRVRRGRLTDKRLSGFSTSTP